MDEWQVEGNGPEFQEEVQGQDFIGQLDNAFARSAPFEDFRTILEAFPPADADVQELLGLPYVLPCY